MIYMNKCSILFQCLTSKKTKEKLSTERQVSPDDDNASGQDQSPLGLLQPDIELWEDISHVQTNIQNLESVKCQVEALAVLVIMFYISIMCTHMYSYTDMFLKRWEALYCQIILYSMSYH